MKKPVLAITMGDPAGIGPEVTVKALQYRDLWDKCIPIVVGDAYVLEDALRFSGFNRTIRSIGKPEEAVGEPGTIECVDLHALAPEKYQYGQVSAACGEAAFQYVVKAIEYAQAGRVAGVVTAPINKEALHSVVQLRDTQSRKNIGIVGMYLPAMPIFLCLLRLAV